MPHIPQTYNPFDFDFQVLECPKCRGPITAPASGDRINCEFCGNIVEVQGRDVESVEWENLPKAPSQTRVEFLKNQLVARSTANPFDSIDTFPKELVNWKAKYQYCTFEKAYKKGLPEAREMWEKAKLTLAADRENQDARFRVFWIADRLARFYEALTAGDVKESKLVNPALSRRAVLETALTRLKGTEWGYALRCKLACAAARAGDVPSAIKWISSCDPEPDSADLDSEYRIAAAWIYLAKNEPENVLEILGRNLGEIPLSGTKNKCRASIIQVHCLEMIGDSKTAGELHAKASNKLDVEFLMEEHYFSGLALSTRKRLKRNAYIILLCILAFLLAVGGGVAYEIVSSLEKVKGSLGANGQTTGVWSTTLNDCSAEGLSNSQKSTVRLFASDSPAYCVRMEKVGRGSYNLSLIVPHMGPRPIPIPKTSCSLWKTKMKWEEDKWEDQVATGHLNLDCTLPSGDRIQATAEFKNCE